MGIKKEPFRIAGHVVELTFWNIAGLPERVDGLVSSDDNYLSHGGGVSAALWGAAGAPLPSFVALNRPSLRLGDVFVSPAFHANARVLLHAVTLDLDKNRAISEAELATLYLRVFESAVAQQCRHIALPLLASGAAGISARASATALVDALVSGLPSREGLSRFTLTIPNKDDSKAADVLRSAERREREIEDAIYQVIAMMPAGEQADALRQAWEQYTSGDAETRGPALAVLWGHVSDLKAVFPSLIDADVVEHLSREVRLARNRIAHGRTAVTAHDWGTLLSAVQQTLNRVKHSEAGSMSLFECRSADSRALPDDDANFDLSSSPRRANRGSPRSQGSLNLGFRSSSPPRTNNHPERRKTPRPEREGNHVRSSAPVRELRDFLQAHLPGDSREALKQRFEERMYQGTSELKLLECLIQEVDLEGFLVNQFSHAGLRAAIRAFRGDDPPHFQSASKLASWFLRSLGFPQPVRPSGLRSVRQAVQSAHAQILLNNDAAIRGAVQEVAQRLEYVCRVMLRFIAQAAYRKAPEQLFREWQKLGPNETLARAGLGNLIVLVESLNSRLETDSAPEVQLFVRDIARGRLFPPHASELASLRNAFLHYRPQDSGEPLAGRAGEFFKAAQAFLNYLSRDEGRLFPRVVLVDAIRFDKWGRRVIEARDDEGNHEVIFTDEDIIPGETYFMHPLTNPLRVDPILVPAGDLLWLDD